MKKYLFTAIACLNLFLVSCSKDDNEPESPIDKTGEVRYEATVSDPENYKIRVLYTTGLDVSTNLPSTEVEGLAKEVIVESPFTFEQKAKKGTYLWLSAMPVPKSEDIEIQDKPKSVEVKMYIDGKLFKTNSGENYALVQYVFGQDDM